MRDFVGTKTALINDGRVLTVLRDNKSGIHFPGMWDLPGGAREDSETPAQVAIREIKEELGINIGSNEIKWKRYFPAVADATKTACFMVIELTNDQANSIVLGTEGQKWKFMAFDEFFNHKNLIEGMKDRLRTYLDRNESKAG